MLHTCGIKILGSRWAVQVAMAKGLIIIQTVAATGCIMIPF